MTSLPFLFLNFFTVLLASDVPASRLGPGLPPNIARQSDNGSPTTTGSDLPNFAFPQWSIFNFNGACSPGGCLLTFHLSSPATTSGEPAISATCENINGDERGSWQPCSTNTTTTSHSTRRRHNESRVVGSSSSSSSSIWALPLPAVDAFAVSVQHRFSIESEDASTSRTYAREYNVTGNVTVDFERVKLPANLTVLATSVEEVWSWTTTTNGADAS